MRVRARLEKVKKHLLKVTEIPFGTTTTSLIDSILSANDKNKIKISKIEDNTAEKVEIMIHLPSTVSAEEALPALYAFTDCEVSLAPNACVIQNNQPQFISVNDLVKSSANLTRELLRMELEIKLGELQEKWHFASLEKIFIEKRIYRDIEKEETWEGVISAVDKGLKPYVKIFKRAITQDDILRLLEIKIKRISKYDSFRADEQIKGFEEEIEEVEGHLAQITRFAVRYLKELKKKYGKGKERKTEISQSEDGELIPFDRIVASQVVVANETLYLNRKDGFAGYALKKDEAIEKCSTLDDVIVFGKDGVMKVMKVADKMFVGKAPLRVAVFRRDEEKVYNMVYRDGKSGRLYAKKFKVGGVTRDKEYPLFKVHSKSRIFFFAVHDSEKKNSNILVHLDPELKRVREKVIEFDFAWLELQGRSVKGSTLTAHKVDRVVNAPSKSETGTAAMEDESSSTQKDTDNQGKEKPSEMKAKDDSETKDKEVSVKKVSSATLSKESADKNTGKGTGKEQATFDF